MKKVKSILRAKAAAVLFVMCFANLKAQIRPETFNLGAGAEQFVSGNWHGTFYSAYLSLSKGKNVFSAGPVIQKRSMMISGAKVGYSRILMGGDKFALDCDGERVDERFQLNAFGYAQYINNVPLSYSAIIIEERSNKKMDFDWNQLRLSTAELCTGFELHYKITQNISWKNYFGACVYYHVNYKQGMYHERIAPVLVLGTGISIKHF